MKSLVHRGFGLVVDQILCGTMAVLHRRHARRLSTRVAVEKYIATCDGLTRAQYFAPPATLVNFCDEKPDIISWSSASSSAARFPVNARARVTLRRPLLRAPPVFILHSLMSASD